MNCHRSRSRGGWHSYIKKSMTAREFGELTVHLEHCSECRNIVSDIQETSDFLIHHRSVPEPPIDLKYKVMAAIDIKRYDKQVNSGLQLFNVKNWGLSMVAAGLMLFCLNLTPLASDFESGQALELNSKLGQQLALPFEKLSMTARAALVKIETPIWQATGETSDPAGVE